MINVLFVEDDEDVLETIQLLLADLKYEVTCVSSGEKCLELLRNGFRGLIFMDVMMPHLDGWDTLERAVQEGLLEGSLVCMLTAVTIPGPKSEKLTTYVQEYVKKPFTVEEIMAVIERSRILLGGNG